jgi:hypothetical protein
MSWLRGLNATQVLLATIAAVAVIGAAGITLVVQETDAKAPRTCDEIFDRADNLSPELKQAYGQPGHPLRLPRLATPEEIQRCGDPELVLELRE